jgi:leucyl-tRNA synthetase
MDFKTIESKWQKNWEKEKIFEVKEDPKKKKFYVLEMYPYPSASGLHMGHARNYAIGDCYARFKRMQGFNVLYPMGYDSFGLPAENAAIAAKSHPKKFTEAAIKNYIEQQKKLGFSYDWNRMLASHDPSYYKWNQYFFLKFLEKGLVYRKKAPVTWCPKCDTVLANEQVHGGKCWRHKDTDVEIKQLEQWFIKTTKYSEELLEMIDGLQWPEKIKAMQKNWIGKSFGTEIDFEINGEKWPIFTTRPDTIYGVTFMVISAQHPRLMEIVTKEKKKEVSEFLKKIKSVSEKEIEELEKEGVFTGSYAKNPLTNEKIPVYVGNFVIAEYGSGMVMGVPAHDQRDFEFAKKYKIPIKVVVKPEKSDLSSEKMKEAYVDDGILVNSGNFNGMNNKKSIEEITRHLESKKLGKKTIQFKLRDWLVSRQRYWGTPIPVIYCDKCGIVPVPEKELPVLLPDKVKFGEGNPLATNRDFVNTVCPKCKIKAKRETDTMDTFFDSSWYYIRYCDNKNSKEPFDKKKVQYWMPVDQYIGGAEHACMHLIYARFFTKALRDLGFVSFDEPFTRLFNQGMIQKDGFVMSKSRGNVVTPEEVLKKYSADTGRLFLLFVSSPDKDMEWTDEGIDRSFKFLTKFYNLLDSKGGNGKKDVFIISKREEAVKFVTQNIEEFKFNVAIKEIMELVNYIQRYSNQISKTTYKETLGKLVLISSPFIPHICEEIWHNVGNKSFLSLEKWPEPDETKIDKKVLELENIFKKTQEDLAQVIKLSGKEDKAYLYFVTDKELEYFKENLEYMRQQFKFKEINLFLSRDPKKHDPENKSSKAKYSKPGIYLE